MEIQTDTQTETTAPQKEALQKLDGLQFQWGPGSILATSNQPDAGIIPAFRTMGLAVKHTEGGFGDVGDVYKLNDTQFLISHSAARKLAAAGCSALIKQTRGLNGPVGRAY